jgi:SAM-dependent methyltransferase
MPIGGDRRRLQWPRERRAWSTRHLKQPTNRHDFCIATRHSRLGTPGSYPQQPDIDRSEVSPPIKHRQDGDDAGARPTRSPADSELQSEALASLAAVRNYHAWLTDLALPHLGDHPLELGSGLGDYAQTWLDAGVQRLTLTESDRSRSAFLRSRFANEPRIDVRQIDILDPPEASYSSLVAFNVLEHIEDDVGALRASHRLLAPDSAVIVFVPAFMFAMGRFDRGIGHFRRYTKQTLRAAYKAAGLEVESIRYVNAPGLLAWYLTVRLLGWTPKDGFAVQLWDRTITRAARAAERRVAPPFGQSIFAVGRGPRTNVP